MHYLKTTFDSFNINLPEYFYHGTNECFKDFDLKYMSKNYETSTLGIYFTQHLLPPPYSSTAEEYAENAVAKHGGKPYVYKCKIYTKKPLVLNSNGWYSSNTYIDKNRNDIIRWLQNDNYDSVVAYDFLETDIKWKDYILVTKNIDIIKIVEIISL